MNILWIPHSPSQVGVQRRDRYLIDELKKRHKIYTLTWQTWTDDGRLSAFLNGLRFHRVRIDDLDGYHVRRIPDVFSRFKLLETQSSPVNQFLFRRDIRRIVRDCAIDLVVTGPTSFMTGYPPFDLDVPLVFDYLDCADWTARPSHPEKTYIRHADAVLCVSRIALERATSFGKPALYLPNGADVERMRSASGWEVRRRLGLENSTVVSLIGLTCSPSLYFLESILLARRDIPDLKCLLVGYSPEIEAALSELPDSDDTFIYTGPVPYAEIASYFAATDIGMYPVDDSVYFSAASPIKIFEYTAAGKPIVVPRLTEADYLGFKNLVFASPDPISYAEGIIQAATQVPVEAPDIDEFDWRVLSRKLEAFLEDCFELSSRVETIAIRDRPALT